MDDDDARSALGRLIAVEGADCASLSRLLGRNPAYIQQYLRRGSPRRLAEADRAVLARFFGVAESVLGGPSSAASRPALRAVPRLPIAASAGPGTLAADAAGGAGLGFSPAALRALGVGEGGLGGGALSTIRVSGASMAPTLVDGDEILVDRDDAGARARPGIYVIRLGDALHVKRLVRDGTGLAIRSDNPAADPVTVDDPHSAAIVGRVVWFGRALR